MNRSGFLWGAYGCAASLPASIGAESSQPVTGVAIPNTALAEEATALARSSEPIEIYYHSLRAFLFAELVAAAKNIEHDREAVYVASILHDAGLAGAHISARERFEVDGANVARSLLTQHGVSRERADLIWDAIALHDNGGIARWKQPEVVLVNAGVAADFGAYLEILDRRQISQVLKAAPRDNFVPVFIAAVAEVARRKPFATGNCFVTDVAYRKVAGFHLDNFCDLVKDDPFASYA